MLSKHIIDFTECYKNHKHLCQRIVRDLESIDDPCWKDLKTRFIFASTLARDYQRKSSLFFSIYKTSEQNNQGTDADNIMNRGLAWFFGRSDSAGESNQSPFKESQFKTAEQEAAKITDINFILKLYGDHDFTVLESEMESIKDEFMKVYKKWKGKKDWPKFLKGNTWLDYYKIDSTSYKEETDAMYKDIAKDLGSKLESMYSKGYVFIY